MDTKSHSATHTNYARITWTTSTSRISPVIILKIDALGTRCGFKNSRRVNNCNIIDAYNTIMSYLTPVINSKQICLRQFQNYQEFSNYQCRMWWQTSSWSPTSNPNSWQINKHFFPHCISPKNFPSAASLKISHISISPKTDPLYRHILWPWLYIHLH